MRILGIESSSLVASTAIYEDGITMAEYTVDFKMTHSQTLLPMIEEILPEHVKTVTIEKNLEKGFDYRKITVEDK